VNTDHILRTGDAQYTVIGATVRGSQGRDGATVQSINPGSPAAESPLRVGDTIVAVDGSPVTGSTDLVVAIRTHQPGEKVTLTIRRDGDERDIVVGLDGKTG
jgi:putative serine protease PepD